MQIQNIINQSKQYSPKVLVVGDIILDQYIWTDVNRISPEAPVPVCHVQKTTYVLGAAGNVANNLMALGADVNFAGILGNDVTGTQIKNKLEESNIKTDLLIQNQEGTSILKSRVIAKQQQLCRLDYEDTEQDIELELENLSKKIRNIISEFDVLIMSDYNKGLITESFSQSIIQSAKQADIPVIVDPKGYNLNKYKGVNYITPNMKEFVEITNVRSTTDEAQIDALGKAFIKQYDIDTLILTRSEQGISVISRQDKKDYSTKAKEVVDITGAGDTVVAALAYGIGLGISLELSIEFANIAAGVVVSKIGTETASLDEIQNYV